MMNYDMTFGRQQTRLHGFSLLELMIVITIIGLLTTQAIPSYQRYMLRAKFSKLQSTLIPLQLAISECLIRNGNAFTLCDTFDEIHLTPPTPLGAELITLGTNTAAIQVETDASLQSHSLILRPTSTNDLIEWAQAGTCKINGFC